jgi:hypothetical protein
MVTVPVCTAAAGTGSRAERAARTVSAVMRARQTRPTDASAAAPTAPAVGPQAPHPSPRIPALGRDRERLTWLVDYAEVHERASGAARLPNHSRQTHIHGMIAA